MLKNEADAPLLNRQVCSVSPLKKYTSRVRIIEPSDETQEGCFPGTGWSEERD
jgi:hypothetical protein